jgi:hypothetical protein
MIPNSTHSGEKNTETGRITHLAPEGVFWYNILMSANRIQHRMRHVCAWLTVCTGTAFVALMAYGATGSHDDGLNEELAARLLPAHMRGQVLWKTIKAEDITKGASVPPHVNVIFHMPYDMQNVTRKTLFGDKGRTVRYWGYCFPDSFKEEDLKKKIGILPGYVFLSELEQTNIQKKLQDERRSEFTTLRSYTEDILNEAESVRGKIRHQKEVFRAGDTCYLMTEEVLPIGVDEDRDGLNTKLEQELGTLNYDSDSDDDGILDGVEYFGQGTSPVRRDTDGDGIIDSIEDKNKNGRLDPGETSPVSWDTDRDGLCDGYCLVDYSIRTQYSAPKDYVPNFVNKIFWEDKNLNGIVDDEETDPLNVDSDGDGVLDDQEFYQCHLAQEKVC